jgi:sugar phosphate isomerase/epimerase
LDPEKLTDASADGNWKRSIPDLKIWLRQNHITVPMAETLIEASTSARTVQGVIDLCVKLDIPLLNIACAPPPQTDDQKRSACSLLRECARYAALAGVRLVLETYGGITGNAQECLRTLEKIGEDNIGINYDTGNVLRFSPGISGTEMAEKDLRLLSGHLGAMHLKGYSRKTSQVVIPGHGDIDFTAIFRVLEEINFSGEIGLDLEPTAAVTTEDQFSALQETLQRFRTIR